MGDGAAFGRKVKGVKIYAEDAADYLELLLRRYLGAKQDDDTFSSFVGRLDADELARFAAPPVDPPGAAMSERARRAVLLPVLRRAGRSVRPTRAAWRCESCDRTFELAITSLGGDR